MRVKGPPAPDGGKVEAQAAEVVRDGGPGRAAEARGHGLAGRRLAPDVERQLALHDHVLAEHGRQRDRGARRAGRERHQSDSHPDRAPHRFPPPMPVASAVDSVTFRTRAAPAQAHVRDGLPAGPDPVKDRGSRADTWGASGARSRRDDDQPSRFPGEGHGRRGGRARGAAEGCLGAAGGRQRRGAGGRGGPQRQGSPSPPDAAGHPGRAGGRPVRRRPCRPREAGGRARGRQPPGRDVRRRPQAPREQGRRRDHHRDAQPLALPDGHLGLPGRQGRLRGEARLPQRLGGPPARRGGGEVRAGRRGGHAVALGRGAARAGRGHPGRQAGEDPPRPRLLLQAARVDRPRRRPPADPGRASTTTSSAARRRSSPSAASSSTTTGTGSGPPATATSGTRASTRWTSAAGCSARRSSRRGSSRSAAASATWTTPRPRTRSSPSSTTRAPRSSSRCAACRAGRGPGTRTTTGASASAT